MKYEVLEDIYDFYKKNYSTIEKHELYKWKAVKHFQENWDIEADDFYTMLDISLKKVSNLMSSGNYYPHRMIVWAASRAEKAANYILGITADSDEGEK